ncbi:hypothetical protein [Marinomonas transparens]|uniref:Uncharacterized protein n=1 Tax=Marinomonas transparens TaxID=2795388 RepID=A0A934JP57_9GAMM|nr:hypothetical protein [Marinomonas transparens]MBJ7539865.1 hypothetical protein [Marinomonas transparens]
MNNNLTADAKSSVWFTTQRQANKGRRTAHKSGFFMSAALYLPVMTGGYWFRLRLERLSFFAPFCGETNISSVTLSNSPLRFGGSKKQKRRLTMSHLAHLRQKYDDRLSVYGKRVKTTIRNHLPKIGDSPRLLLDPNEISSLSTISVDKVQQGIKDLEREGYIARMFKGRRSKAHVYALLNPELRGDAWEVWG